MNSITGTAGNDTITGTVADDEIFRGDGNDTITGAAGNDVIYGGKGTDTVTYTGATATLDSLPFTKAKTILSLAIPLQTPLALKAQTRCPVMLST